MYGKLADIWLEDFKEFQAFEEGGGAISGLYSKWEALEKIQEYERKEFGLLEEELCKVDDLEVAYLQSPKSEERNNFDWYVNRVKENHLKVWAYFV
jgi:hypothetical protein